MTYPIRRERPVLCNRARETLDSLVTCVVVAALLLVGMVVL